MDWATISALATAFGTLVLALATFASIRSANRSARTAERALLINLQPLLFPSRLHDPAQKVTWADNYISEVPGGQATAEVVNDVVYLTMSLRNMGAGIALIQGWYPWLDWDTTQQRHEPPDAFRKNVRDMYIAPNDIGFWQGAVRDRSDDLFQQLEAAIAQRTRLVVDVLYCNAEGGQRMISRFSIVPAGDSAWMCTVGRHFGLDHNLGR